MVQNEEIKNKISKIKPFLETTYHVKEIGVRVDLVMKSTLKPFIGKRILQEVFYL